MIKLKIRSCNAAQFIITGHYGVNYLIASILSKYYDLLKSTANHHTFPLII